MKRQTVFLCSGEGGHYAEIAKLLSIFLIPEKNKDINFVGILEGSHAEFFGIKNYFIFSLRDKNNLFISFLIFFFVLFFDLFKILWLILKYKPIGLISSGPGSVILAAFLFKFFKRKIVFIENASRLTTRSITGKIMYHLSDKFYIQNIELLDVYPNAIYAGLL
jgi:UDP-N-acetylglucosamine:LPS N-acetylglucosamine transferase